MDEVGPQVAGPVSIHHPIGRKRDLYYQMSNRQPYWLVPSQQRNDWNPKMWEWDSQRFEAKPVGEAAEKESLQKNGTQFDLNASDVDNNNNGGLSYEGGGERRGLDLNLSSGLEEETTRVVVTRPNKRVKSGSPPGRNYPKCQVDNCMEDLSVAKDYHRRHKVCEVHSKAIKALVGSQMQRFCQQCSRFHLLSEFDEGKRSCRRRLAGHNRRRRKTQPEEVTSGAVPPGSSDKNTANMDVMALLTALACAQGRNGAPQPNGVPQREQLLQILNKINALPLPMDLVSKLNNIGVLARKNLDQQPSAVNSRNDVNGAASSPSTMDLLAVLSATLGSSAPEAIAFLSKGGFGGSNDKTKLTSSSDHHATTTTSLEKRTLEFPPFVGGGERTSTTSNPSPSQDSDSRAQDRSSSLSLQLFTSSPEDERRQPTVAASSGKYYSSASSYPVEDRSSPSSSPVMQELFPMQTSPETMRSNNCKTSSPSPRNNSCLPLDLFGASNRGAAAPANPSYASSGSDYSPPSLNSGDQDRTGKIVFKLLGKDPSQLPGTLRTEISSWLSSIPSEMESYIRPGCVILSVYVAMSASAWEQLEENLLQRVSSLVQDSEFWSSTRFLVNTGRQLASHKHGRIRLSKSWRTLSSPELITVSPVAVVAGEETTLVLRGRSLTNDGISFRCAHMGNYTSMEVTGTAHRSTKFDELNVNRFTVKGPGSLGRCFLEVENGFRSDSFPVIIANAKICKELNRLEDEQTYNSDRPSSREEVVCFLNELGWLFQKKCASESDFSLPRFKFLLVCSVERDYCSLVRTLLDMMVERNFGKDGVMSKESLDMLAEIQLLSRAVKRKNAKMAETLIQYSVNPTTAKKFIFLPSVKGPGDITPLHLAASTSGSDDMIDILTNDPQEIGLSSWNTLMDASGQTPFSYAAMRNNHSYNTLVARKLVDKRNGQISLNIESEIDQMGASNRLGSELKRSCNTCASVALKYQKKVSGTRRLFPTRIIHSMVAVATVCVCVCVFMHAFPIVREGSHFSWGGLDYGSV